jgi:hypothetical protein
MPGTLGVVSFLRVDSWQVVCYETGVFSSLGNTSRPHLLIQSHKISDVRAVKAFDTEPDSHGQEKSVRGRSPLRSDQEIGKGRAISM